MKTPVQRLMIDFIMTSMNDMISGLFYSLYTIYKCADRFMKYPSSIKPAFKTEDVLKFPKSKIV